MNRIRVVATALVLLLVASACGTDKGKANNPADLGDPGDCTVVDMASSPEKIDLMTTLAKAFNGTDRAKVGKGCVFVRPQKKSSGGAAQLLYTTWNESVDGPRPVIWSPAASSWGQVVNQRLIDAGQKAIVTTGQPFMVTPLTIAMPKPMADALGYPGKAIGWTDILTLAKDQKGWGAFGHPEWGPFKLGKTNPNFSTSGLSALIAQTYEATGKTSGLSKEDLDKPEVVKFGEGVESAVVHYGDTTLTFLNNLYRADQRGTALSYVSAVAVEEKSVIDYNQGNPDGILDPGEQPRPPRIPLVAIYPKEGTLFSDNPLFILDAPWVTQAQKDGAKLFEAFVKEPDNQRQVLSFHFRPGNPAVPVGDPITAANGVDPNQPQTLLEVPRPDVLTALLDKWATQRKKAKVLFVLDVSGSMGEDVGNGQTRLDLAKQASIDALDLFSADDQLGLRIFSNGLGDAQDQNSLDLLPYGRVADQRERLRSAISGLFPTNGTPLYTVAESSYQKAVDEFDPTRINAVVLLTDGQNDDGTPDDDNQQLQSLLQKLRSGGEGQASKPVRVFTIAYSADAGRDVLRQIAEAASSASYNASDPKSISSVLNAVVSNF
jgi:Ca-activated chloride channel family protein